MISLLFACANLTSSLEETCFSDPPESTVRVHRVSCSAELLDDSVRRGDFILENPHLRFVIRESSSALTDPIAVGGSLIYGGKEDLFFELRPTGLNHRNLTPQLKINEDEASISFHDDNTAVFSYHLPKDSQTLFLNGFDEAILHPLPQTTLIE